MPRPLLTVREWQLALVSAIYGLVIGVAFGAAVAAEHFSR